MTASPISVGKSFKREAKRWYDKRSHFGVPSKVANAYVYAWHEEDDPACCKIGYCTNEPFTYLCDESLPHQRRLPVIFLTIGLANVQLAKLVERKLHQQFHAKHLERAASQEWFQVHKDELVDYVRANESTLV